MKLKLLWLALLALWIISNIAFGTMTNYAFKQTERALAVADEWKGTAHRFEEVSQRWEAIAKKWQAEAIEWRTSADRCEGASHL